MDKQQLLEEVKQAGLQHSLSEQELLVAFRGTDLPSVPSSVTSSRHISIANILYYIGGGIVCIGIAILIGQNWEVLSTTTRILVTFGVAVMAYVAGVLLMRDERFEGLGQAFHLIAAIVLPVGVFTVFDAAHINLESLGIISLIFLIIFLVYLASTLLFKKTMFLLFAIAHGTILFFVFTQFLLAQNPIYDWHIDAYRIVVVGLSYMLFGYYYSTRSFSALSGLLYSLGSIGFLGATMSLGGWSPDQNLFWEAIFPLLVFGIIYLSIYVKSRSFLVFGSLFLMGYILKITAEYFSQGLGWPLALVIAGFFLMAVGYLTVYLNRRYLNGKV